MFVTAVLTMYSNLQASFDELEGPMAIDPDQVLFPGFNDGRDEIDLLRVSRFLIDEQGRYDWLRLEGDDLSALMPMRDTYERMLDELRDRAGIRWDDLSEETIRAVLDAGNRF